jgi:hypothetical protein
METCDMCAEECRKHASSQECCRRCAIACEACAAACKNLALTEASA